MVMLRVAENKCINPHLIYNMFFHRRSARVAGRQESHGFTLIEVLVVLALLSLLLFMAVPSMKDSTASSKLSQSADQFVQHLGIARQTAIKENTTVEVRLYKFNQTGQVGDGPEVYSAWQMFKLKQDLNDATDYTRPSIAQPILESVARVAPGVGIVEAEKWSSILTSDGLKQGTELIRGLVQGLRESTVTYRSFSISADGTTSLDRSGASQWFLTFVNDLELRKVNSANDIRPGNFITIQIDPYTANTRWFQP